MARDNKSSYYDEGGIEVLSVIEAKLTAEEYLGFLKGTAIRYLLRAPFKHGRQSRDLEKCANYAQWASEQAASMDSPQISLPIEPAPNTDSPQTEDAQQSSSVLRDWEQALSTKTEQIDASLYFKESWSLLVSLEDAMGERKDEFDIAFTIADVLLKVVYFNVTIQSRMEAVAYALKACSNHQGQCELNIHGGDEWLPIDSGSIATVMGEIDARAIDNKVVV